MSSDVLVKVDSVSKKFCRDLKTSLKYGLYDIAAELNPLKKDRPHAHDLRAGEFWAVKDVSFELKRGECLGLIGHNGAGKTTLLKMLNGLIKPDAGRIEMNGRVGALIALGAGFNPILTGRENIYVNGSVLGLTKREIDGKVDEIIDFAEMRDAIDSPVQSYSSGMQVRLGFAVASTLNPDILLIDEVLAVGDLGFVIKCLNRVASLAPNAAILFVSHHMPTVSLVCGQVLLMDHGRMELRTEDLAEGIRRYVEKFPGGPQSTLGSGEVALRSVRLGTSAGDKPAGEMPVVEKGGRLEVDLDLTVHGAAVGRPLSVFLKVIDLQLREIADILSIETAAHFRREAGAMRLRVDIPGLHLNGGRYSLTLGVLDAETRHFYLRTTNIASFIVKTPFVGWAACTLPATWSLVS